MNLAANHIGTLRTKVGQRTFKPSESAASHTVWDIVAASALAPALSCSPSIAESPYTTVAPEEVPGSGDKPRRDEPRSKAHSQIRP